MKHYTIPNTDLSVSRLAYGTWHLGGSWDKTPPTEESKERAARLIAVAVDCGINHIDLADIYSMGKSDEVVGYALKQAPSLRAKVILQGKCGIVLASDPDFGPPQRYDFSFDHIIASVEKSLTRLGTDHLDILALHRPDPLVEYEELARAIDSLHASGKVRYFGVSNHTADQIALLQHHIRQPIILNQLEVNLLHHALISDGILANMQGYAYPNTAGLMDYCRLNQIMIQAWSPTAGGGVFAVSKEATNGEKRLAQKIVELARIHDSTEEAIALAWLLRHPVGIQPIVGTLNTTRIERSVPADEITLSRKEWYTLLEAARGESVP